MNRIQNEQKRKRKQELNTINQYDMKLINGLKMYHTQEFKEIRNKSSSCKVKKKKIIKK